MRYLQTRWTDSFCLEQPLTPSYGRALLKYKKFSATRILSAKLMKERKIKKARNEQDRMRRKSGSSQHVQKNGVIYKGTAVRQIAERKQEVTNQALVRLCKKKDKVWAQLIKQLPKLVEMHHWNRLCLYAKWDSRVVEEIPLYRDDSWE
jgi:hypothetical protein